MFHKEQWLANESYILQQREKITLAMQSRANESDRPDTGIQNVVPISGATPGDQGT
jgi:hypothetical protein